MMWNMCAVPRTLTLGKWVTLKRHSNGQKESQTGIQEVNQNGKEQLKGHEEVFVKL